MATIASMQELYPLFEKVFPRPTSFHNEYCCVQEWDEATLLGKPLRELTEDDLGHPISHGEVCFGSFEEIAYFIPRVLEVWAETTNGFDHGTLGYRLWALLLDNEERYRQLGLWDAIEKALLDFFYVHTAQFRLVEAGHCCPCLEGLDLLQEFLGCFMIPLLTRRPLPGAEGLTQLDEFVQRWAADDTPSRVAILLLLVWEGSNGFLLDNCSLPESLLTRLGDRGYGSSLLSRAEPALSECPDLLGYIRDCLDSLVQGEG